MGEFERVVNPQDEHQPRDSVPQPNIHPMFPRRIEAEDPEPDTIRRNS
jgi:hypothetical protein